MVNLINDFVEDLNYNNILLDLKHIDKEKLKQKLKEDNLNKLWRLENANYLWVENCDYQGEEIETQEDLKEMIDDDYVLYSLYYADGLGYFILVF